MLCFAVFTDVVNRLYATSFVLCFAVFTAVVVVNRLYATSFALCLAVVVVTAAAVVVVNSYIPFCLCGG